MARRCTKAPFQGVIPPGIAKAVLWCAKRRTAHHWIATMRYNLVVERKHHHLQKLRRGSCVRNEIFALKNACHRNRDSERLGACSDTRIILVEICAQIASYCGVGLFVISKLPSHVFVSSCKSMRQLVHVAVIAIADYRRGAWRHSAYWRVTVLVIYLCVSASPRWSSRSDRDA